MVIGHDHPSLNLPKGYSYIRRSSEQDLHLKSKVTREIRHPAYVWSEYAAWFENYELWENSKINGLIHYRCALNLLPINFYYLPTPLRFLFLKSQKFALASRSEFLIVGELQEKGYFIWDHFRIHHPNSEHILKLACAEYDRLKGNELLYSENRLKKLNGFHSRNIFITNTNFGHEWFETSLSLALYLDRELDSAPEDRWGGFVLERIFHLFLIDYVQSNNIELEQVRQIYFVKTSHLIKMKLLKVGIIKRIRDHLG